MVTKKKEQASDAQKEKPVLLTDLAQAVKKVDLFATIRHLPHPVEEILTSSFPLHSGRPEISDLSAQESGFLGAQNGMTGHPENKIADT
jgi:hypothetical protein